mmetsp:Transcript_56235/g.115000  ORF Transcript_56235/g.115000 Transcript_56235/m.115000 type:complete len:80 (+) Transcript_56235:86-325(+)|eukprot:CAMPEP_0181326732 /NCGR_PEP_ID=MMETSP1101-20121128/21678_1 /TAXON_ID=46948 /ORGANISM="Rhodomonas abbreviata, Strain Caron Lab Isolate" /LENGTH=79 /DNA_ID=CAMNT_0023435251 /DNA_START=85 /DNA_END=324 /DNA_ORIENTATION=+
MSGTLTPLQVITGRHDLPTGQLCNPLPGYTDYFNSDYESFPGCKLHPEVVMNGGVKGASITIEPGLWGPSESGADSGKG